MRIYTWNVRTLYESGALKKLGKVLTEYKADITAIQEVRWTGQGVIQKKDFDIYYSCHDKKHEFGVAFIVAKKIKQHIIDFKPVSPKICVIRIKQRFFNISLITAHAPTEEKTEEDKDAFYDSLEKTYDECPKHDIKIIIGDLNAKIGKEDCYQNTIGKWSLHDVTNNNGNRAINFATSKNMTIGSTCFPHKRIHKFTWTSPDGMTHNQIDHVMIDNRHYSNLLDVRSFRGANMDSDHYLVGTKLRARISNIKKEKGVRTPRYNTHLLKQRDIAERYQEHLCNTLREIDEAIEAPATEMWNTCKEIIRNTAEEVLGRESKRTKKDWFDQECNEITEKKNNAYKNMQQRRTRISVDKYKQLRREEKRTHKKKKKLFEQSTLEELEIQRGQNETRKFYKTINNMRKTFKPRTNMCKNKEGLLLQDKDEIMNRWVQHFSELLCEENNDEDVQQRNDNHDQQNDNREKEPPTIEEINEAISQLKNNKSPGSDDLPPELFKYGGHSLNLYIHKLISKVWIEGRMPEEWCIGIICPLHKKGDQLICKNYRGITLLNTIYKVLSNIIYRRMTPYTEKLLGEYQSGFRPKRSTVDQIFVVRQILEKANEYNIDTYHLFIDFKAAYDSIIRSKLYEAMNELQIPSKLIELVKMTMSKVTCKVRIQNQISNAFQTDKGVRQGDALACLLFNIALEKTVRDSGVEKRGTIMNKSSQIMAYADDIDIISRNLQHTKENFTAFNNAAKRMGLTTNEEKTKLMIVNPDNRNRNIGQSVEIGEQKFEVVDHFTYLGSMVTKENRVSEEINKRITAANRCYYGLNKHFHSRRISQKTKLMLYRTLILPVLTYGSETWTLSKADETRLLIFERKVLRKIFGAVCENGVWRIQYNFELYRKYKELTKATDVVNTIKIGRLRWAGHVIRANENYPPRKIFKSQPVGTRRKGRPRLRWKDGVDEDAREIGIANWQRVALDRNEWRRKLKEAKAQ